MSYRVWRAEIDFHIVNGGGCRCSTEKCMTLSRRNGTDHMDCLRHSNNHDSHKRDNITARESFVNMLIYSLSIHHQSLEIKTLYVRAPHLAFMAANLFSYSSSFFFSAAALASAFFSASSSSIAAILSSSRFICSGRRIAISFGL